MTTLNAYIAKLPPEQQKAIGDLSQKLILEFRLNELRKKSKLSQVELAAEMGIAQSSLQRLEKRGMDLKLSSLKRYVEALGGEAVLTVKTPCGETVFAL